MALEWWGRDGDSRSNRGGSRQTEWCCWSKIQKTVCCRGWHPDSWIDGKGKHSNCQLLEGRHAFWIMGIWYQPEELLFCSLSSLRTWVENQYLISAKQSVHGKRDRAAIIFLQSRELNDIEATKQGWTKVQFQEGGWGHSLTVRNCCSFLVWH